MEFPLALTGVKMPAVGDDTDAFPVKICPIWPFGRFDAMETPPGTFDAAGSPCYAGLYESFRGTPGVLSIANTGLSYASPISSHQVVCHDRETPKLCLDRSPSLDQESTPMILSQSVDRW